MEKLFTIDILLMISVSLLTSSIVSLNRYATDLESEDPKVTVYYISEALISTLIGVFLGIMLTTLIDDIKTCIVATGLGAYFGRYTLNVVAKLLLFNLKNFSIPLDEEELKQEKKQYDEENENKPKKRQDREDSNKSNGDRD